MGTDAELQSRKKRLACYIDRKHNVDTDGMCDYDEWENGVIPARAAEILKAIISNTHLHKAVAKHPPKYNLFWTRAALAFVETLDADDTVTLVDEHSDNYHDEAYAYVDEPDYDS